jgi:hypothetical protein
MNLETFARAAVDDLNDATRVDTEDALRRLHHTRQRRRAGKVVAVVAATAVGVALVQVQRQDRALPPATKDHWVLVTGSGSADGDWSEPLPDQGVQTYPAFLHADPARRRFVISAVRGEKTFWEVMTPGGREPVTSISCTTCFAVAIGPGPDEITMASSDLRIRTYGPKGWPRRELGQIWTATEPAMGVATGLWWSPDGTKGAATRPTQLPDQASVSVVLKDPYSSEESTLFAYSEHAPAWYDVGQHTDIGAIPGWSAPAVLDLEWAPDSSRLAFILKTTVEGAPAGPDTYQLSLVLADLTTGNVDEIADLGRCGRREQDPYCGRAQPSLAWTPDGQSVTVLAFATLTTYDQAGKVLVSEPTMAVGPIAWLVAE